MIRVRPLLLLVALASTAHADVIISSEADCAGKAAGAECASWTIGKGKGVCQPAKCSRKDYSQGIPPKTKYVDCLKCEPAPSDAGPHTGYGTAKKGTSK